MSRTYDRTAQLPLHVDDYELERLERRSGGFTRVTTVVRLRGAGFEGVGEDVSYSKHDQDLFQLRGGRFDLAGTRTFAQFSAHLDSLELFAEEPEQYAYRQYRRWAFESAALDLALQQVNAPLHLVLGREVRPLHFVVSMRLGSPPSLDEIHRLRRHHPRLRFKLDPSPDWSAEFCSELAELGCVDVVDLKGAYSGTPVDMPADPDLYERVANTFEHAWIEDPKLDDATGPTLDAHLRRVTWDAPIHSIADVAALPFEPVTLNCKPSRFGRLDELFDFYDHCEERGIQLYGGGQFELGPGRGQIQYLASLFHGSGPNDVAPIGYNAGNDPALLPGSPLEIRPDPIGFRLAQQPWSM